MTTYANYGGIRHLGNDGLSDVLPPRQPAEDEDMEYYWWDEIVSYLFTYLLVCLDFFVSLIVFFLLQLNGLIVIDLGY